MFLDISLGFMFLASLRCQFIGFVFVLVNCSAAVFLFT